jgi:uncharacterized protein
MKKRLFALLLVLVLCACTVIPAFATTDQPSSVQDYAQLLTEEEAAALKTKLDAIAEKFSVQVAVITVENCGDKDHADYAKAVYQEYGYGLGKDKDGILLLIDMDEENRGWYIYGKAIGSKAMTNSEIEEVGDTMTPDLSDGNYAAAFDEFAAQCETFIAQAKTGDPFDTHNLPKEPFNKGMALVIALIAGFIIGKIYTGKLKGQLNTVRKQAAASGYVKENSLNISNSRDFFLYRNVSKTAKESSSKSDGGSSTHTSSSGASHGGGGGKF